MRNRKWFEVRQRVLDALPRGKARAKIADRIHEEAGTPREWRTQVHTREFIRSLRLDGHPICSSPGGPKGYWVTDDPRELKVCIVSIRHRATEIEELCVRMEQTYDEMGGTKQTELV